MKVLLAYPSKMYLTKPYYPSILSNNYSLANSLPLGILYIASYLSVFSGNEICVLDLQKIKTLREINGKLRGFKPDVVGLSVQTATAYDSLELAKYFRRNFQDIKIIMGGPHANLYPAELLTHECVDFAITGYGEMNFCNLINEIESGRSDYSDIPGIYFKTNCEIKHAAPSNMIPDLDVLPFPDREILDWKNYQSSFNSGKSTSMVTSRGCPYNCIYCSNWMKIYQERKVEGIIEEMGQILNQGYRYVQFWDETYNTSLERVAKICQGILSQRLEINYGIRARVDRINEEILRMLKESGCQRIAYGVESGNQRILDKLGRKIEIADAVRTIELTKNSGIKCSANFILGSPEEEHEDIQNTINTAKKMKPDYAQFTLMTIFPGTKILKMALENNILTEDIFRRNTIEHRKLDYFPVWEGKIKRKTLIKYIRKAYLEFYLSYGYLINKIREIRSPYFFLQQLIYGFSVVKFILVGNKIKKFEDR